MFIQGVKKRIVWGSDFAKVDVGDSKRPDIHRFFWKSRSWARLDADDTYIAGLKWILDWDNLTVDHYDTEAKLKLYIIRFAYGILPEHLIPSEILADAGLYYTTGDWVDEWNCTDKNDEIGVISEETTLNIPSNRRIRVGGTSAQGFTKQLVQFLQLHNGGNGEKPRLKAVQAERIEAPVALEARFRRIPPDWEDFSAYSRAWIYGKAEKVEPAASDEECVFRFGQKDGKVKRIIQKIAKAGAA